MTLQILKNDKLACELQYIVVDDIPWFRGLTVAKILQYERPRNAIKTHVRDNHKKRLIDFDKMELFFKDSKIRKDSWFISEPGLYTLIMHSKMKKAEKFQDWVCEDVLPSIRKNGKYELPKPVDTLEERRLNVEEVNMYMNVYDKIDNPKLKTVIVDWMHNNISGQKVIAEPSQQYARDITDICKHEFGFVPDMSQKIKIGQVLKKLYMEEFDEPLLKYEKYCNGSMRKVNAYPKDKEQWIIDTLRNFDNW
jgi:prophage antirepressor-like protein